MDQTHNCGELNINDIDKEVLLKGWIQNTRRLGSITFVDLRDETGITQVIYNTKQEAFVNLDFLKNESYISVLGTVKRRKTANPQLKTGVIEVVANYINVINTSITPPFVIANESLATESTRLQYRYLDLRRAVLQNNLRVKSHLQFIIHNFFYHRNFLNIETPILSSPTPEGARNYVVPSRINHHKYYALAQSPQLYKQMLMIGGIDRYYQIVRCFRDEDLRADRQPEFSQLDIEMRNANFDKIKLLIELLCREIWKQLKGVDLPSVFPVLSYKKAVEQYGTDKPDLRFGDKLISANHIFSQSEQQLFSNALMHQKSIKVCFTSHATKKADLTALETIAQQYNTRLMVLKYTDENTCTGSLKSKITTTEFSELQKLLNPHQKTGTYFFIIDTPEKANFALGAVRAKFADLFYNFDDNDYEFVWINKWPLFEFDQQSQSYTSLHHPFTKPVGNDPQNLKTNFKNMYAEAYDLVVNGHEIGGGSLRIDNPQTQATVFEILGLSQEKIDQQFGWFIEALKYGTPPHGGIAFGLDRIAMLLVGADSIRDVIAFPKNNAAQDTTCGSPTSINQTVLDELNIKLH